MTRWVVLIARRGNADCIDCIASETDTGAYQRAEETANTARRAAADVRHYAVSRGSVAAGLALLQSPLLLGSVNLAEVVDARIGLGVRAGMHVVRNRDRSQEADDSDHDHDFHQCKAGLPRRFDFHN